MSRKPRILRDEHALNGDCRHRSLNDEVIQLSVRDHRTYERREMRKVWCGLHVDQKIAPSCAGAIDDEDSKVGQALEEGREK